MLAALRTPDGGRARPDADDERLGAAGAGPAARRRGAPAGDGQPRLARRRGVRRDERRSTSRSPGCSTGSTRRARPASRRSRSTWSSGAGERDEHRAAGRAGRATTGLILRFIEYMDVGHTNGWRLDEVVPAAEIVEHDRREMAARAGRRRLPRRGRRALALRRRARRDRRHRVGDRSRSAATAPAPGSRPRASSTRACSRVGARPAGAAARPAPRDAELADVVGGDLGAVRDDRYSERRAAATADAAARSRCSPWAAEAAPVVAARLVHTCPQSVRTRGQLAGVRRTFVDNRVDPPRPDS